MPIYFAHLLVCYDGGILDSVQGCTVGCTLHTVQVYTSVDHWMSSRKLLYYKPITKSINVCIRSVKHLVLMFYVLSYESKL